MNPEPIASSNRASNGARTQRRFILSALALAAVGVGVFAVAQATDEKPSEASSTAAAPTGPTVTVAAVESKLLVDQRELLGRVDARESVEIRPRVSGHIAEVKLIAGQFVREGDVLFTIDPRWYQAQFDLAAAQTESARVRVAIAEREARRSESLLAERAISVEEADTRNTRFAETRAELLAAEATLASARLDLDYTTVRSPINGRVSRAYVTAGNLISGAPGSATLLTTVVSTGEAYVYADVDEATVLTFNRLLREGRIVTENGRVPVEMQLSDETDFPHRGYIESTDNRLDPGTGSLVLRLTFPDPNGRLVPGLFARVRLPVSAPQTTFLISERAIGTDQSQKFVLTVDDKNTVAYRAVKLGPIIDGKRIVREGLRVNDRVIVNGLQRARPGMTVTAQVAPVARPEATSVAQR